MRNFATEQEGVNSFVVKLLVSGGGSYASARRKKGART